MTDSAQKRLGILLGILVAALTVAATMGLVMPWQAATRVDVGKLDMENKAEHIVIRGEVGRAAASIERVGGDVRVIKCLMLSKTKAQRDRCALDP